MLENVTVDIKKSSKECFDEVLQPRLIDRIASIRMPEIGQYEMTAIHDDLLIAKVVEKLILWQRLPFGNAQKFLFIRLYLYLREEYFGLELALVCAFGAQALVIKGFPKDLVRLLSPDLFPFPLSERLANDVNFGESNGTLPGLLSIPLLSASVS